MSPIELFELLQIDLSPVGEKRFLAIATRVPDGVGDARAESELPFWEGVRDWSSTIIKTLESRGFRPENFPQVGEQDWMVQAGILSSDRQRFDFAYLEQIGKSLYQALFPPGSTLEHVLQHSLRVAEQRPADLHLRLKFAAKSVRPSRLADYPWELLHDGQRFLLHHRVRLSRYIAYEASPPKFAAQERLRVLLISARPQGLPQLSLAEQQAIRDGLQRAQDAGLVQVQVLSSPTLKALKCYLTDCAPDQLPHVVHFDGHGVFGRRCADSDCQTMHPGIKAKVCTKCQGSLPPPQGYLAFEPEQGQLDDRKYKSANQVAVELQPYPIALVVLSACQSGMAVAGDSVFNGMAQNLIDQRIPAVVGMQYSVQAKEAREFAEQFYRVLGNKKPLLTAVNQGIRAMDVEGNQWYRPVLYLRWQDDEGGQLFGNDPIQVLPGAPASNHAIQISVANLKLSQNLSVEGLTLGQPEAMPPANSIFISYRRSDSNDVTGRIYDRLSTHFGRDVVFKDVHSIPLGVDFRTHLRQQVGQCQVLVAVIGPTWASVVDTEGKRRLDNSMDWVRAEIEMALTRGIAVIPLLVGGARLPSPDELPECLKDLAYRNGATARPDPDFHQDLTRLIRSLEEILGMSNSPAEAEVQSQKPPIRQASQLQIDALKKQRKSLEAQFNAVVDELTFAVPARAVQLELHRDNLAAKIQDIENQLCAMGDDAST